MSTLILVQLQSNAAGQNAVPQPENIEASFPRNKGHSSLRSFVV